MFAYKIIFYKEESEVMLEKKTLKASPVEFI